ncbi:hypothetical protein [Shewanella japonica]|uniref:hypothetical protein n=1 Tax=Shewanella japonica TaxID=93973 RepID=UPI0024955658|nr:hypothetical protein [Shewanella japonica]
MILLKDIIGFKACSKSHLQGLPAFTNLEHLYNSMNLNADKTAVKALPTKPLSIKTGSTTPMLIV